MAMGALVGVIALSLGVAHTVQASGATQQFGPFPTTADPDGGTCTPWAIDSFDRYFKVQANNDGSFTVREEYKNGSFVTTGPSSPGGCETGTHHGSTVLAGISGTMQGYLVGKVSGGIYTPNGCSADPTVCATTSGFIGAVFPGGSYTCLSGGGACTFSFEYASGDQRLIYHSWKDANNQDGTEYFLGDIATS